MDTSYANWARGNRLTQYAGLTMDEGIPLKYGGDYAYVEIPVAAIINVADGGPVEKLLRNQTGIIIPACRLNVRGQGYRIQVEPNPVLGAFGPVQAPYYIHPDNTESMPSFYIYPRKDLDISDIPYAVRLYLRC